MNPTAAAQNNHHNEAASMIPSKKHNRHPFKKVALHNKAVSLMFHRAPWKHSEVTAGPQKKVHLPLFDSHSQHTRTKANAEWAQTSPSPEKLASPE